MKTKPSRRGSAETGAKASVNMATPVVSLTKGNRSAVSALLNDSV